LKGLFCDNQAAIRIVGIPDQHHVFKLGANALRGNAMTARVAYHVRVRPAQHEIEVEVRLEGDVAEGRVRLETPTWVPGDYDFDTYGRDVFSVKATDPRTGATLEVCRDGWQAYHIESAHGEVAVTYTAYCSSVDFGEPCGILDDRNGVLLGTRYLRAPAHSGECRVTYELPTNWELHHPAGARQIDARTWEYPSYEVLLDTPVSMGHFDKFTRNVHGTDFHYIFLNQAVGFDSQVAKLLDRLDNVAAIYHDMFGSFPFENYTYVFSLNPTAQWGLEHLTSTMIGLDPETFIDADQAAIGVRVCAHELFHAWNVRRLRPAPLDKLDFYHGSFTEGLWVAEGFTRYYEFLTCTRSGVYVPQQFFSAIVNYFRHLAVLPAYQRVSAVDSSYASYLNHSKYPGRVNNAIDYYDKGMVIAFNVDAFLRLALPDGSLDTAFSSFYREFVGRGLGYSTADVRRFFGALAEGLGELLDGEATAPGGLALAATLQRVGFAVNDQEIPYIGLVFRDDNGPAIYGVLDSSPAGQSGIAPEDVITQVNGYPFSANALKWVIAKEPSVTLDVLRGNQPRTYTISTGRRSEIGTLTWNGDAAQAARIATWLGQEFAPRTGENFPLDFYENFHGIETVI
jgi:predicted metalloprotease with PDZ domain